MSGRSATHYPERVRRLLAESVVTPAGVREQVVIDIDGDRIAGCTPVGSAGGDIPELERVELERIGGWIVPGFVDTHVHGGGGFDYATEDADSALAARAFHAAHGTTTSLASLVTAPIERVRRQLQVLAELCDDGHFAGIHLEGPFLSPAQPGAHDPTLLRPLDPALVEQLLGAAGGHQTMITIAPELPGAAGVIRQLTADGVTVAIGHTDADRASTASGVEAGARTATHLFNAMRALHHREPGPVPVLLDDPRVAVELIADGHHVHPDVLAMAVAAAGTDRVLLVTDAMVAAGMPDGGFRLGDLAVEVDAGVARLVGAGGPGPIAGSTATMATVFEVMTGIVGDVGRVALMAATNPARHLGLDGVGRIETGARADLCVVDAHGRLQRVMRSGEWLPG